MSIAVLGVAHTGFTVRDLDTALALWTDVLGFEPVRRFAIDGDFAAGIIGVPGAALEVGVVGRDGQLVELLQYTAPADAGHVRPRPCDIGAAHIALTVTDIAAAIEEMDRHGWTIADSAQTYADGPRKGTQLAYLHDADGGTIELVQPPD